MRRLRHQNRLLMLLCALLFAACAGGMEEAVEETAVEEPGDSQGEPLEEETVATEEPDPAGPTSAPLAPTQPAPTTEPESVTLARLVQETLAGMEVGQILYNPPTEMRVGEAERVEVRIGPEEVAGFTEGLEGGGEPIVESLPISTFMKVRLSGESFTITPLTSEEQVVIPGDFSEWIWEVTPQRAGEHRLYVTVTARVKLAGYGEEQKDLEVIERTVQVQVDPGSALLDFVERNGEWLVPAVLLPLFLALGRVLMRRLRGNRREDS